MKKNKLSIVIPTLNEAGCINDCLQKLQFLRQHGHEVIVVDGGSSDGTMSMAEPLADVVVLSKKGRAVQMNRGAASATGDLLLFLHADTSLPHNAEAALQEVCRGEKRWGRFDVRLSGEGISFRVIEHCMNLRSRLSGIVTGDQGIFVSTSLFREVGGFPEIALMEDIAISRNLRKIVPPLCLRDKVITSSRRWEKHGLLKTVMAMWTLRFRYALGGDTTVLLSKYEP